MDNFEPYNVLLSIATNIPVLLMTAFVLQGHKCFYNASRKQLSMTKIIFCKRNGHMCLISSRRDGGADLACAVCSSFLLQLSSVSHTEEGMIVPSRSALLKSAARHGSDGNRSWSRTLESMLVLGLYQHVSERPWSGSPSHLYSDLPCHKDWQNIIYYFNFQKKKLFVRYACIPNRFGTNTCTVTPLILYIYIHKMKKY